MTVCVIKTVVYRLSKVSTAFKFDWIFYYCHFYVYLQQVVLADQKIDQFEEATIVAMNNFRAITFIVFQFLKHKNNKSAASQLSS